MIYEFFFPSIPFSCDCEVIAFASKSWKRGVVEWSFDSSNLESYNINQEFPRSVSELFFPFDDNTDIACM